ncbi:MAG: chemotaxis protein CheW [Thermodesulfovibrionales bacterium]|nr:chemotaxis protein CheW [Thermodesulfovibrionales bacterium]
MITDAITAAQYLSFELDDEVFAIDITKVREVLEFVSVTKIPQTPDFMRGVINLRGGVVPVVDMKQKFGTGETEKKINTCVIITEVQLDDEPVVLGVMADSVDEVFSLDSEQIEPAPRIGTQLNTEFLMGMGKKDDKFVLILDIDRVFSADELERVVTTHNNASDGTGSEIE